MKYLFDTDTIIYWLKGNQRIEDKVLKVGLENVATSIITLSELYYGAHKSKKKEANLKAIAALKSEVKIIDFVGLSSKLFGEIKTNLEKKGQMLDDADIMIAAISLANNMTLVSNNIEHFKRIPRLKLENWLKD